MLEPTDFYRSKVGREYSERLVPVNGSLRAIAGLRVADKVSAAAGSDMNKKTARPRDLSRDLAAIVTDSHGLSDFAAAGTPFRECSSRSPTFHSLPTTHSRSGGYFVAAAYRSATAFQFTTLKNAAA